MRSQKEESLDARIHSTIKDLNFSEQVAHTARLLCKDDEIQCIQEYANTVSIKRLGFNDHGPVHMRTVALNGLVMMGLLKRAGIQTNMEIEACGGFDDSVVAVLLASFFHDFGMTIGRHEHELHSAYIAYPIIERILREVYPTDLALQVGVRSLVLEGIAGHMGNRPIHSLEAGLIQIADGCDMTKGRARIIMELSAGRSGRGDIHQYSANSIEQVKLSAGEKKPIRIEVLMSAEVGLFQVEEVLLAKISNSTAKDYIELFAVVNDGPVKQYL